MTGPFVKLYGSILDSSVWEEGHATVRVWIALLAMADADGIVRASQSGLRRRANVSDAELTGALKVLEGPDGDDSSGVGEGERIIRQQGGWLVVNHRRYRDLRTEKQVSDAERQAAWRAENKAAQGAESDGESVTCHNGHSSSPPEAEAEAEAYTEKKNTRRLPADVRRVFEAWKHDTGHHSAKLDKKRAKRISARLNEGFSVDDLIAAIVNRRHDDWLMGRENSPRVFDGIETLLRDAAQVEKLRDLSAKVDPAQAVLANYGSASQVDEEQAPPLVAQSRRKPSS